MLSQEISHTLVTGRVSVHPRGFGFLTFDGDKTAFINPPDLNPFLDGDRVTARVVPADAGRFNATELVLQERIRSELFGSILYRGRRPYLKVDRLVSNTDWPLDTNSPLELEDGLYLVAALEHDKLVPLRIVETEADLGVERCVVRHAIRSEFSPELVESARQAVSQGFGGERRDLRDIPTITIDAPTTTDIDDALSALPPEPDGALRVLVSIADVDALVGEGSLLDGEARRRATSVYLAGRVIPMLPEELSSAAVSLLPGLDRPTLTAELRINPDGDITSVDVYESQICSHARLSYDAVSDFLLGQDPQAVPELVAPTLRRLRAAAARLSVVRAARGGVELATEEAYVSFDPTTRQPTGVEPRGETMAHRIVERLMVAANEAIAHWLVTRGQPGMFRVHPEPGPEKVQMLAAGASNFGIEAAFGRVPISRNFGGRGAAHGAGAHPGSRSLHSGGGTSLRTGGAALSALHQPDSPLCGSGRSSHRQALPERGSGAESGGAGMAEPGRSTQFRQLAGQQSGERTAPNADRPALPRPNWGRSARQHCGRQALWPGGADGRHGCLRHHCHRDPGSRPLPGRRGSTGGLSAHLLRGGLCGGDRGGGQRRTGTSGAGSPRLEFRRSWG